ncbi:MAG: sigma-70 family RNA polymerase sigma factor [Lysinibacillus sp.]
MQSSKGQKVVLPPQVSDDFEAVLEQVQPMITAILKKCHVYKNFDHYRQIAAIAVWDAWRNADATKGNFSAYIYTMVQGRVKMELLNENQYAERYALIEDDKMNVLINRRGTEGFQPTELLEGILDQLTVEERKLLEKIYIEGCDYVELEKVYGISIETIRKRRNRLIQKIRLHLQEKPK